MHGKVIEINRRLNTVTLHGYRGSICVNGWLFSPWRFVPWLVAIFITLSLFEIVPWFTFLLPCVYPLLITALVLFMIFRTGVCTECLVNQIKSGDVYAKDDDDGTSQQPS